MKLRTLAAAVIAATVSVSAQADFKVSGDVGVAFSQNLNGVQSFGGQGSEVIFTASEEVNGLTYFGSFSVNVAGATVESKATGVDDGGDDVEITEAGQLRSDDLFVGVKGGFGQITLGDTDNGCDSVDTGWVAPDEFLSHSSGGCGAGDQNNITYKNSAGNWAYAVSYSPDVDFGAAVSGEDSFAVGVKGTFGNTAVSLGYEDAAENVVFGISSKFGPVAVGIRASDADGQDDVAIGYTAAYSAGNNTAYIGIGDTDSAEDVFLGYQRKIGSKTKIIAEFLDRDGASDNAYHLGLHHSF